MGNVLKDINVKRSGNLKNRNIKGRVQSRKMLWSGFACCGHPNMKYSTTDTEIFKTGFHFQTQKVWVWFNFHHRRKRFHHRRKRKRCGNTGLAWKQRSFTTKQQQILFTLKADHRMLVSLLEHGFDAGPGFRSKIEFRTFCQSFAFPAPPTSDV